MELTGLNFINYKIRLKQIVCNLEFFFILHDVK